MCPDGYDWTEFSQFGKDIFASYLYVLIDFLIIVRDNNLSIFRLENSPNPAYFMLKVGLVLPLQAPPTRLSLVAVFLDCKGKK